VTAHAALSAAFGLALMLLVAGAYVALARRFRILWHPVSIVTAVASVSIVVAVLGELLFRGGVAQIPAMLRRSAIGGVGWGVVIAAGVWIGRRLVVRSAGRSEAARPR
jgi:hypothetical protein